MHLNVLRLKDSVLIEEARSILKSGQFDNSTVMTADIQIHKFDFLRRENAHQCVGYARIEQHRKITVGRLPQGINGLKQHREIHTNSPNSNKE